MKQDYLSMLWFPANPCKWQIPRPTVFSFCCTCCSSCFILVLVSEDANSWSCSFWAEAVASLSLSSKAVFKSWTQRSEFRYFSSISRSCKVTERIHSCQVSFYTEESAAAQGFMCCRYLLLLCPNNCNHLKYFQSFAPTSNTSCVALPSSTAASPIPPWIS